MPGKSSNDSNGKPPCSLGVSEMGLFKDKKSKFKENILRNLQSAEDSVDRITDIVQELRDLLNEGEENTAPKNN